jgi:hypothetical protein
MRFPTWLAGPAQHQGRMYSCCCGNFLARILTALASGSRFWREQWRSCGGDRWRWCAGAQVSACAVHRQTGAKISTLVSSIALHRQTGKLLVLIWLFFFLSSLVFFVLPYWIVLELIDWRKTDMEAWRKHQLACIKLKLAYYQQTGKLLASNFQGAMTDAVIGEL